MIALDMPARAACFLLFVSTLGACAGPAWQADQIASLIDPVLRASIYEYLDIHDAERADQLLAGILDRPEATPAAVLTILAAGRSYQAEPVGVQPSRELRLGGHVYYYGLYVPDSYRPDKAYRLVICLHGAGFTGDAYLERWQNRLGEGYILACPTLPMGNWWTRTAEDLVLATIRAVEARYRVDPNRVFLTGMSNGGIGAYLIGAHHASRFAAVVPMAAGLDDILMPFLENFDRLRCTSSTAGRTR
jgi:poly(3-hydroxybutyrate) depolymerase